jgi:hypothetical protein
MSQFQTIYLLAMIALSYPAWGRQRFTLLCLWGNLAAMLLASLAMDLGLLDGASARLAMMTIDLATGVVSAMRPGLPRVISAGYALTVPLYVPLINGLFTRGDADFTLVCLVSALQIMALAIGTLGGNSGGGSLRRFASGRVSMAIPKGDHRLLPGTISSFAGEEP